jgi:diguanylate cyclase (GGDEF)-like protein
MPPMTELRGRTIERRLTAGYVCALAIVALLTIASHFILMGVLRAQGGSAAVINVSGRQRMLSQRIASLAAQYEMGDAGARGDLRAAVDRFERQNEILVHGDAALNIPAATMPALRDLYFEGPVRLDAQTHAYIAEARQILADPPGDPAAQPVLARIFAQATPLLSGLERVVAIHQRASETVLRHLQRIQDATLFVVLLTLILEALGIFRPLVHRVSHYARQLTMLATLDALTGLFNRRSFMERGAEAISRCRKENGALGLLMIDADDFKRINDTHHHAGGDAVLRALAQVFRQEMRGGDCVGRLGGEEFAILLPKTGLTAAHQTAERLRGAVAEMRVESEGRSIRVSVSIGIAALARDDASLEMLMARADRALYRAKANGRNRVEAAA